MHSISRLGRWVAELVLVFVGVYAAFWLNSYQQHRQDAERRDQILAFIEQTLSQGIESSKINRTKEQEPEAAEFRRALNAGGMPPLRPFVFITDYSPSDLATMLQSGGVQLLDVQTLRALRNDESVIRWVARMARYQKLSDELIVPNLDKDIPFFYDPVTKKLRKQFEIYPEALEDTVKLANDLERTHTELLKQIQAERKRNR